MHHTPRTTAALTAAILLAAAADVAAQSTAVRSVQDSVVRVGKDGTAEKSAAFAVDARGGFLTTRQAASRSAGLVVRPRGGGPPLPTRRVESTAGPGLTLLQIRGRQGVKPVPFGAREPQEGEILWIVPPKAVSAPQTAKVLLPQGCTTEGSGIIAVQATRTTGINGSPVVDGRGRAVGVVRANRSVGSECTDVQVLLVDAAPTALPTIAPPERNDFPATAVVGGLATFLVVTNGVLWLLRRRRMKAETLPEPAQPAPAAEPPVAPAEPAADDDLDITLKRSPHGSADDDDDPGAIVLK